jgi:hypothetical protein
MKGRIPFLPVFNTVPACIIPDVKKGRGFVRIIFRAESAGKFSNGVTE